MRRIDSGYTYIRFFSMMTMILTHIIVWTNSSDDFSLNRSILPSDIIVQIISHFSFLPLSLVVIGGILLERFFYFYRGQPFSTLIKLISLRSLFFIASGIILNTLAFGKEYSLQWDVLFFLGVSFIIISVVYNYGKIFGVVLLGIIFASYTPYPNYSPNFLEMIVFGNFAGHTYYPLFPWLSWFCLGFTISHFALSKNAWKGIGVLSFVFVAFNLHNSGFNVSQQNIWGAALFMPEKIIFATNTAKLLLCYSILTHIPAPKLIQYFSKNIFPLYFFHIIIIYHLTQEFYHLGIYWVLLQIPIVITLLFIIKKINNTATKYIILKYMQKNINQNISIDSNLLENEYLDSLSMNNLLAFINKFFNIQIDHNTLDPKNLKDISSISHLINDGDSNDK